LFSVTIKKGDLHREKLKEKKVKEYNLKRKQYAKIITIPFVGLGHIYIDKTFKGFLLVFSVCLFLSFIIISSSPVAMVNQLPRLNFKFVSILFVFIYISILVYGMRDLRKYGSSR